MSGYGPPVTLRRRESYRLHQAERKEESIRAGVPICRETGLSKGTAESLRTLKGSQHTPKFSTCVSTAFCLQPILQIMPVLSPALFV